MTSSSSSSHADHSHLKNPDGSWKFTNALSRESSPYFLQHAHNPVDWHPWGPAAFDLARRTGKPVFLSVGYSTCYWCHVMERQVFENVEIATLMNEHFVNIKVDREERPDVDDIYMIAVQAMTGHGGWPMSVFLTPPGARDADDRGLKPFYAGTYFPPEPTRGMPGFPQIVLGLSDAWQKRRDEVIEQGEGVAQRVREHLGRVDPDGELSVDLVQRAANALLRSYDATHGGFGDAPKFPTPSNLFLLLQVHRNNPSDDLWSVIAHTLDRMARGGMYDQIGGGFHRYSTDEKWLVPHFEKMLYDNGQLAEVYAIAHATRPPTDEPHAYADVLRGIGEYVLREMTDDTGAFWSAQDAEVDAMEGGNYVWTPPEVKAALPGEASGDAELALALYGLNQGTNFRDPHHADAQPANVLFQPVRLSELAHARGVSVDDLRQARTRINAAMLKVRDRRKQPGTDDKVLTAWNGMMIAGLARAGAALNEPRFAAAAARAARAVMTHLAAPDGGLLRAMRRGAAKIPAFLDDYAYFIHGLIELHRADHDAAWLNEAARLTNLVNERFGAVSAGVTGGEEATDAASGGYFDTLAGQADLFVRTRSTYDGAIPSGNSQMAHNLIDLCEITGDGAWLDRAAADLRSFARAMQRSGQGMAHMHGALLRLLELAPTAQATPAPTGAVKPFESGKRQVVELSIEPRSIDLTHGEQTVTLRLSIGPDYHLNAHDAGVEGVIATELRLMNGDGIEMKVVYPPGVSRRYEFSKQPLSVYEGTVMLTARLRRRGSSSNAATTAAGAKQPRLVLRYQVCTEMSCLMPREEELPVEVR